MVIRRRRRAIPADLEHQAPAGAARILETWPDGARVGDGDPDRIDWLDADGNRMPPRTHYRRGDVVDDAGVRRADAPQGAARFCERYTAFGANPYPAEPDHVDWFDADGRALG